MLHRGGEEGEGGEGEEGRRGEGVEGLRDGGVEGWRMRMWMRRGRGGG